MREEEKDTVSVIVPIFNDEEHIRSCVDSIVGQTYRELQIILVDDASKDASFEICREYAQADHRVTVLHNEQNRGLSGSREIGYRKATGGWICFVDHDDRMAPYAIERLLAAADDHTDIITGKYKDVLNRYFDRHEWDADGEAAAILLEHDDALDALGNFIGDGVPPCLWGKIYRRELFEKVDFLKHKDTFPLIYFEDTLLTPALIKACRGLKIIDRCMYIHRIDYNSVAMSPGALAFHLQTARAADIVMPLLNEPYARNTYAKYMQGFLLIISKNWHMIRRYHHKDAKLMEEMEVLFQKYYNLYEKLDERTLSVSDICIRIFRRSKIFFSVIICNLWFQGIARLRHRLLSK